MKIWQKTNIQINRQLQTASGNASSDKYQGLGGVEKHIVYLSEALERKGHQVWIGPTNPPFVSEIIHTHGDRWIRHSDVKNKQAKWIHVFHGTSVGRMLACREFLSFQAWKGSLRDFLPTPFIDGAIAVGENAAKEAKAYFRVRAKMVVIPNGADPNLFRPLKAISDAPAIIFMGRAEDRVKNVQALLGASHLISNAFQDFTLYAAPGISESIVSEFTGGSKKLSFLENLGSLSGSALVQALAKARALVLCSFYEGDSLALREAMALGLPILASAIPSIEATLFGYNNVFYFNPRKTHELVMACEKVLNAKNLTPAPLLRSWDQVAEQYLEFYSTL